MALAPRRGRDARPDASAHRWTRPRNLRRILLYVVAGALVLVLAAGYRIATLSRDLREAQQLLRDAASALEQERVGDARELLGEAQQKLFAVNDSLHGAPDLDVMALLPVARQNIESLRGAVALAATVVDGGNRILDLARPLESPGGSLEVSLTDGAVPVSTITSLRAEIEALSVQLPVASGDDGRFVLPQVNELRREVVEEAIHRRVQLEALGHGLGLLSDLAGAEGPRRYLIAVANTAEMRGTGGMMLNYGVLEGDGGVIDLTAFGRVEELDVSPPVSPESVDLPQDFLDRWPGFELTRDWRNATLSADFTLMAPVLEAMYRQSTGLPIDGVLQVDPQGLAALLRGVGPVTVAELGQVTADNVVDLVLNEAYRRFPGVEERSDVLGDVAEATFQRLVDGDFPSVRPLAEAIDRAVDGRHVMLYSRRTEVSDAVRSFSASGGLPPPETRDYAHLTVQNVAGNKLDYYLDTSIEITGQRPAGRLGTLRAVITLANRAPAGVTEPRYVFGPFDETQRVGEYRGVGTLYLPAGTSLTAASGGPFRLAPNVQTEAGRPLVSFWIDVPAGQTRAVTLDLQLAPRPAEVPYRILLVPSARVRPTTARVAIDAGGGAVEAAVTLDRSWSVEVGQRPTAVDDG